MILVTGATGMVGGHLIWHLLQTNNRIVAIKRLNSNLDALFKIFEYYSNDYKQYVNKIEWRIADLNNEKSLELALDNINIVYHCAAIVSLSGGNEQLISNNVTGTKNLLNACLAKNIEHFCFVSSIAACGTEHNHKQVTEESPIIDIELKSAYSQSKYYSEQEVWQAIKKGLNAVIVNPGVILGYSGTNKGSSELFYRVKKGLPFYTNGGSGYIDVKDVVKIMIQLTNEKINGERYILTAENCSNKDILSWMAMGYKKSRPVICISEKILITIAALNEFFCNIVGKHPSLDRSMAKSASKRTYYSANKISKKLDYKFSPIKSCILEICEYDLTHIK